MSRKEIWLALIVGAIGLLLAGHARHEVDVWTGAMPARATSDPRPGE